MKSKVHDQAIQARKKLFCNVTVNNYLCNVLHRFWSRRKHVEALNQRTETPADFTVP